MNRSFVILMVIAVVALGLWGQQKLNKKSIHSDKNNQEKLQATLAAETSSKKSTGSNDSQESSRTSNLATSPATNQSLKRSDNPQVSLNQMGSILADAARGSKNFEAVIRDLKMSGQQPQVTQDSNPATGDMYIVRTQNPLPGTRYFHAQYFTDENNQRFMQHMSFEFKPGPSSMNDAIKAALQNFPVGEPTQRKTDFIQWDLPDDYVLWIKKKSAQDLTHDPFNAHDPQKDVGTIQMTVELKIHDDDQEGHDHH